MYRQPTPLHREQPGAVATAAGTTALILVFTSSASGVLGGLRHTGKHRALIEQRHLAMQQRDGLLQPSHMDRGSLQSRLEPLFDPQGYLSRTSCFRLTTTSPSLSSSSVSSPLSLVSPSCARTRLRCCEFPAPSARDHSTCSLPLSLFCFPPTHTHHRLP